MPFNKPCLICGVLSRETRCEQHKRKPSTESQKRKDADPVRKARKKALYGNKEYQAYRAQILATATHCHICKKAFVLGDKVEADHIIAGHPQSPLLPAHRLCNQRRGNKPLQ